MSTNFPGFAKGPATASPWRRARAWTWPRAAAVIAVALAVSVPGGAPLAAAATEATPWRLARHGGLPDWLHMAGSHRTRYETLANQFRRGGSGGDQMIALRSILLTELRFDALSVGVEFIDSRAYLDDAGSPLTTTMINPAELLQGYVAFDTSGWLANTRTSTLKLGRLTLDVGSRRFIARSKYRNTINTFTGFEWQWRGNGGEHLQIFYTLPVRRKPTTQTRLQSNSIEFDEEDTEVRLWGVFYGFGSLPYGHRGEVYVLGLDENDAAGRPTRNRELYTPGLRVWRPRARGRFDYLVEAALQFGDRRDTTAATDTRDRDHFAHFEHVEIGYSFAHPLKPHLKFEFDYASGDQRPGDGDSQRFETLFGARRFEFGPTGIYGPFSRGNLVTPGLRLNLKPTARTSIMLNYRGFWLASRRDTWIQARVRDVTGQSGSFVAQQIEGRLRYDVRPGNVRLEFGAVGLFDGDYMRTAPQSPNQGDAFYGYTQVSFTF